MPRNSKTRSSTDSSKLTDIFRKNFHDLAKIIEPNLITAANVLYSKELITHEIKDKVYTKGVPDYLKASELVSALSSMLEAKSNKQLYLKKVFKALSDEEVIEKGFLRKLGTYERTDSDKEKQKQEITNTTATTNSGRGHASRGRGGGRGSGPSGRGGGRGGWNNGPPPPPPGGGGHGFSPRVSNHFSSQHPSISRVGRVGGGAGGVVCRCGIEAILLTVRKEQSINKGRQFYKCPKNEGEGKCSFFLWADEATDIPPPSYNSFGATGRGDSNTQNSPGFLYTKQSKRGRGGSYGMSRNTSNCCQCGLPTVQKTVQQGPNKGRLFYTCSKPRDQQCGYFEWSDAKGKERARTSSTVNNGTTSNDEPAAKKRAPPTCSVCHIPGHNKRSCPNMNN